MASEVFCLIEVEEKMPDLKRYAAEELMNQVEKGYATYPTAEYAEEGRKNGDAYDQPGRTRVVGFRVQAFLPKKRKKKVKRESRGG